MKHVDFSQSKLNERGDLGFADGVYIGLSNEAYHADRALGSSGIRDLLTGGPTYWWNSQLNPTRKRRETKAMDFGSACHVMVLEGVAEFNRQFAETPDPEGMLITYADVKKWLQDHGESSIPKDKAGAITRALMVDASVKVHEREVAKIADSGRTMLTDDAWARVQVASAIIRNNPELSGAFKGGIPEVSVFWTTPEGVRVKCRFDYLKPRANVDLKTLGNTMDLPFPEACRMTIARRKMDVQAALYMEGRKELARLYRAGKVFGLHDHLDKLMPLLERIATTENYGWAWVFIQSMEAPLTWATSLRKENPILEIGMHQVRRALDVFSDYMGRFGPDQMWLLAEPVQELDQSELPGWWAKS